MALNWQAPSGSNFDDTFYAYLKAMESDTLAPVPVNGNPTIGVGFDLVAGGKPVQDAVLIGLGLKPSIVALSPVQAAAYPAGSWQAIEYGYVKQLRDLMVPGGSAAAMDQVMGTRAQNQDPQFAANVSNRRSSFAFANDTEVRQVYTNLLPAYVKKVTDAYPSLLGDTAFATSREKMVLTDLAWNGGTGLLGSGLGSAIASGNRAEAWYQIRYQSNKGGWAEINLGLTPNSPPYYGAGLAKRRYIESQVFGLYDNPSSVSLAEAQNAYLMLQAHRTDMLRYEAKYGVSPDGTLGQRDMITEANQTGVAVVDTVVQAFDPAETALFSNLSGKYGQSAGISALLTSTNFISTDVYVGADFVPDSIVALNNDASVLVAGTGND
ncbi:MAG TPA: hypothetical protein VMV42_01630, partial [archaeon]|nr:hypothetical protein [archaeon]